MFRDPFPAPICHRSPRPIFTGPTGTTRTTEAQPVLLAIIGPPGAGKTTVVMALAEPAGLPVFRLRTAVRAYPGLLADLPPSDDPLGQLGLEAVRRVMRTAFLDHFTVDTRTVLLDNFPATAGQLQLLRETATSNHRRVAILELRADTDTILRRVAARRVCPGCGPDPHAPAEVDALNPDQCGRCGTALNRRDTDLPGTRELRLARYRASRPALAELAARHHIPHLVICADGVSHDVCRLARHAFIELTAQVPPPPTQH